MILRNDWMLVELMAQNDSAIALPEGVRADHEAEVFIVKQCGPTATDCQVGDEIIMHGLGNGGKFKYKGVAYYVVQQENVICVMNRN